MVQFGGYDVDSYCSLLGQIVNEADKELQLQKAKGNIRLYGQAGVRWTQVHQKLVMLQSDSMKDTVFSKVFQVGHNLVIS